MTQLIYRRANLSDLEMLVLIRMEVLIAANRLPLDTDMSAVGQATREYYKNRLETDSHIEYLVLAVDQFVACGSLSIYDVMPTYCNPSGRKGYVMNMYTRPDYRRQGIALKVLEHLVKDAKGLGITQIQLEATDMGKPLYQQFGFVELTSEMELGYK